MLDQKERDLEEFKPQIMIFANGDLTSFEISLQREGGGDERAHLHRRAIGGPLAAPGRRRTERAAGAHGATPMKHPSLARGFTLLEVLIALAIVAMSVGALLGTVTSSASNVIYLKDKTLAEWVALNRLTEVRIDKNMPDEGKRNGNSVLGGMRWEWEEEVVELPVKGMLRIDVRAHATGEAVDDSRPVEKPTTQKLTPSSPSGASLDKSDLDDHRDRRRQHRAFRSHAASAAVRGPSAEQQSGGQPEGRAGQ